jgi:tetratricopeptide (TPR) repeat protein
MFLKRALLLLLFCSAAFAQSPKARQDYDQALKEVEHHNLGKAEKLLRDAIADSPNWAAAYAQLGHVYFLMPKPAPAIEAYERARELDIKDHQLTVEERREVNDNLGIIYGMGHQYEKSIAVLESAINADPEYGAYEYNLACTYSEQGDLDKALTHLKRAWELRNSFQFPDVMNDDSFRRWHDDPRFQEVAREMVILGAVKH